MEFALDSRYGQKLIVLRHSKMIIVHCNPGCAQCHRAGLYTPLANSPWHGALQCGDQQRPFDDLLKYLDGSEGYIHAGSSIKPCLHYRRLSCSERLMELEFGIGSALLDSTFVEFARVDPLYINSIRLIQSRIRINPRRLALASAHHTRLGQASWLQLLQEETLRSIVCLSCPFITT